MTWDQLTGADLILEWCSLRGTGTRASFERAVRTVMGPDISPNVVLHDLELLGHVEVDWIHTGHWYVTPPVLAYMSSSGGNAALVGARNRPMLKQLEDLRRAGLVSSVTEVDQGASAPVAVFVGVESIAALENAASAIGAIARTNVRWDFKESLVPLPDLLSAAVAEFTPSGIQAQRFSVQTLFFEPHEIRFAQWVPGCFEQMSYGMKRYLFVDDERGLHNVDKWVAVHAELNRIRRSGAANINPISWSIRTQSLFCDARAQLPTMWARAAVMCTGLLPTRHWRDRHYVDEFRGVQDTSYKMIATTLGYARQQPPSELVTS